MLKETITYTDYRGNERTEDFYFNLTRAELMEMELTTDGGLSEYIQRIIKAQNQADIVAIFKKLLLQAYGIRSEDGRRFQKSEEISKAFSETEAYSILFMELASDDKRASDFFNAIVPELTEEEKRRAEEADLKVLPGKAPIEITDNTNNQ